MAKSHAFGNTVVKRTKIVALNYRIPQISNASLAFCKYTHTDATTH